MAERTGGFITVTSPALITELASVLAYPKLCSGLTNAEAFVDRYRRAVAGTEHPTDSPFVSARQPASAASIACSSRSVRTVA